MYTYEKEETDKRNISPSTLQPATKQLVKSLPNLRHPTQTQTRKEPRVTTLYNLKDYYIRASAGP